MVEPTLLLEKEFPFSFNSVAIEPSRHKILVGCGDGKIRVLNSSGDEEDILETKGGAIQQILLSDFTRFGDNDIISADAEGNVVLFCNSRILFRASVGHPVSSLVIDSDICGYTTLVAGDRSGVVTGLHLHHSSSPLFRTSEHLSLPLPPSSSSSSLLLSSHDAAIRCLLSVSLPPSPSLSIPDAQNDRLAHYLLVAGSTPHLHFYSEGKRVYTLLVPSLINSMCIGKFTESNDYKTEIALGCENGFIYILRDYVVHKHIQVGHTITQLQTLNTDTSHNSSNGTNIIIPNGNLDSISILNNSQAFHQKQIDGLVCTGHFNALRIFHKTKLLKEISTPDWVHTFALNGNTKEGTLVAGLANNCIQVYKLNINT